MPLKATTQNLFRYAAGALCGGLAVVAFMLPPDRTPAAAKVIKATPIPPFLQQPCVPDNHGIIPLPHFTKPGPVVTPQLT